MTDISYEGLSGDGQTTLDKLLSNVEEERSMEEYEMLLGEL